VTLKRGLEELAWRSEGIDAYICDAVELVRDLDGVLTTIKDNVGHIQELLHGFERSLMFDRKVRAGPVATLRLRRPCATAQRARCRPPC
jgi:hypothetical protein